MEEEVLSPKRMNRMPVPPSRPGASSSTMAERPRELGAFKGVGHFDAKF